jgi:hypothetical protein
MTTLQLAEKTIVRLRLVGMDGTESTCTGGHKTPLRMEHSGTSGRLLLTYVHDETGADASSRWRNQQCGIPGDS